MKSLLVALLCIGLSAPALAAKPARATAPVLPLLLDAGGDVRPGSLLVVLFSLPDCHWCEEVRSHYLAPLAREAGGDAGLVIREVDLNGRRPLTDFDGTVTTQAAFAQRLKVQFAPTVLFLDAQGRQVAAPLVGAGKADFYGAYLDEAIASGRRAASK